MIKGLNTTAHLSWQSRDWLPLKGLFRVFPSERSAYGPFDNLRRTPALIVWVTLPSRNQPRCVTGGVGSGRNLIDLEALLSQRSRESLTPVLKL